MNNNLILIIVLLGCLIASLIWKNVSDNKKANNDSNKFEDLIGAKAMYKVQEKLLIDKVKDVNKQCEQLLADKDLEITTLKQTIADLSRKLDESKKVGK